MSPVINPNAPGKERNRLRKAIALALRELMSENESTDKSRDLIAFITLALEGIAKTVDIAAVAWEKRDYWLKADRFRLEWEWAGRLGGEMRKAAQAEDWDDVPRIAIQIFQKVGDEQIPERHRMGTPWVGAWKEFTKG